MNNREKGTMYENVAWEYLKNKGYELVCRNYAIRTGEIDLIAKDGDCLVFVEVKYRKNDLYGTPLEAVDRNKQRKIRGTAIDFLRKNNIYNIPLRFDVVGIEGNGEITHIKDAF